MRQHDRAGIDGEGGSDDFAGMDAGAVNGARKELLAVEDAVAVVEPEDVELFVSQSSNRMRRKLPASWGLLMLPGRSSLARRRVSAALRMSCSVMVPVGW